MKAPHNPTTISGLRKLVKSEAKKAWAGYESRKAGKRAHAQWFQGYAGALDWFHHKLRNIRKP